MNKILKSITMVWIALFTINANSQGFLHADGKNIVDANGNNFISRSIGTGNWMIQEGYMMKSTDAGINTQWQFRKKLIETIGEANTDSFYNVWLTNHFTRADVDSMKAWGFNSVRPALHYKWFTLPIEEEPVLGENTWLDNGFARLDSLIKWCADNEMYVFLDMHGTPGGQGKNADISDYDPSKPSLWESEHNKTKLIALWVKIAERYKDEPYVAGFDLINEINWDFENSGNQNGCNCNQNQPAKILFERIITAIRTVNTNHMVFVSGNCWGNNYNGLSSLASYDDNLAFTFHKYWNYNDQSSVDWIIAMRNSLNVPLWMSESGENSNTWFTNATTLFEKNNIGWSWWPVKKSGINNILNVTTNKEYSDLLSFWKNGYPAMSQEQAFQAVLKWADNHKIENCFIQRDVIDALTRQIDSYEAIPFKTHNLGSEIFFADYDLGRNNVAYSDTDTANYHVSTGSYVNWNAGWAYRNDGVDIEKCTDTGINNGYNVGWTAKGEWLQYSLTSDSVAAYTLSIRHASGGSGSKFYIEVNGANISGVLSLPGTGGWQKWATATFNNLILPAGPLKIKFIVEQAGSNLNYLNFTNPTSINDINFLFVSAKTSADGSEIYIDFNKEISTPDAEILLSDFTLYANSVPLEITSISKLASSRVLKLTTGTKIYSDMVATVSYSGTSVKWGTQNLLPFTKKPIKNNLPISYSIPGRIQAEQFAVNNGLVLEACTDTGGGLNTSYASSGDYLIYNVHVKQSGNYKVNYRLATERTNAELVFLISNEDVFTPLNTIKITSTGGWQIWKTQSADIELTEGYYQIKLFIKQGEQNLNWFEFVFSPITNTPSIDESNYLIYPNPAKDFVKVQLKSNIVGDTTISIYNMSGMVVNQIRGSETSYSLNTSDLPNGLYVIHIRNNSDLYTQKITIL